MSSPNERKLAPPSFATLVQAFFTEHLTQQRALSARTVAAYRDAFLLFLDFAQARPHKAPTAMQLADVTPALILAFLDHLESERHNAVRSRNARLAALRTFLKFAARRDVTALHIVEQALGVPMKRFERPMLGFLTREEMLAVIGKPGVGWVSQRDGLLLALLYNTGARVLEVIGVKVADVVLDPAACVHLHGKGRKQRSVPLWRSTVKVIRAWLRVNPDLGPASALLPNRGGQAMTRSNVTAAGAGCAGCGAQDAQPGRPGDLSSHPASLHSNASAAVGRGHQCDRAVAWPREPHHDTPVRRGRPRHEGEGPVPASGSKRRRAPLQSGRLTVGLPEDPVTMCSTTELRLALSRGQRRQLANPAVHNWGLCIAESVYPTPHRSRPNAAMPLASDKPRWTEPPPR